MDIILGATGHVGSEVAKNLISRGENITVVTHDPDKKEAWTMRGAEVAVVDIHETEALAKLFQTGQRLFFLNPPADPSLDSVKEEKITMYSILEALKDSGIEKVVAESTYGAQPGDGIGDLGVLQEMEEGLKELGVSTTILRAAYYMSNWDHFLESAKSESQIYTLYPLDFKIPMVAPADIGKVAAELLQAPLSSEGIYHIEGPEKYSALDVAKAFSKALGKEVTVKVLSEGEWEPWLLKMGFSQIAAESMIRMTEITLAEDYEVPSSPIRGTTTLEMYIHSLVLGS